LTLTKGYLRLYLCALVVLQLITCAHLLPAAGRSPRQLPPLLLRPHPATPADESPVQRSVRHTHRTQRTHRTLRKAALTTSIFLAMATLWCSFLTFDDHFLFTIPVAALFLLSPNFFPALPSAQAIPSPS
jgi:hypothetical protein